MADVEKLLELYREMQRSKDKVTSHLADIAAVMRPERGGFAGQDVPDGNRLYDEIFDSTPQEAARGLANALGAMMRPDGQKWFYIRADEPELNDDDDARMWFDEVEARMMKRAFSNPKSRFRQMAAEADRDVVIFNTAAMFIGEKPDRSGMLYQTQPLRDIFFMTDENNVPNAVIRRYMLNCRQAYGLFGGKVGKAVREAEERANRDVKIEHIHVVIPRNERKVGPLNTNMPFTSIWIEVSQKELLVESGFLEFPFVITRFETNPGEDWGRGPGMMALPHANMLQAMDETIIISGQKRVEPPLLVPDDGTFNAANTFPGGISYYDSELAREMGRIPIEALDTKGDIAVGLEMQQDRRQQVMRVFYRHVLNLPIDGPEMTATEVIARDKEFLRELSGLFGSLESDYIAPIVERTFNVMLRNNAFPDIPEVLLGQNVNFEYESPVKRVRQQIEAAAARMWKDDLMTIAAAGRTDVLDVLNVDAYAEFQAMAQGVPLKVMNNVRTVEAIRAQRAEQQQQMMAMQMAEMVAGAGADAGKAVKSVADAAKPAPKPAAKSKAA